MITTALVKSAALRDLIEHVIRTDFPDLPCTRMHHKRLLTQVRDWLESKWLANVEAAVVKHSEMADHLAETDASVALWDHDTSARVNLALRDLEVELQGLTETLELESIVPIDIRGTAVVILTFNHASSNEVSHDSY